MLNQAQIVEPFLMFGSPESDALIYCELADVKWYAPFVKPRRPTVAVGLLAESVPFAPEIMSVVLESSG